MEGSFDPEELKSERERRLKVENRETGILGD